MYSKKPIDNNLVKEIDDLAKFNGWKYIIFEEKSSMLSYRKDIYRINIWLGKMTIGVCFNKNKENMNWYLKRVTIEELTFIFEHPDRPLEGSY